MTRYLGLAEFFWLAEQVTRRDTTTLVKASRVELADSALHAPQAGYGDEDFYPDIYDKVAVLTCRLAWNHPLPTATSAQRGRACCYSSISTVDLGIRTHPTSNMLSTRCSMSRRATSMRRRSRVGSASGFDSLSSWRRCQCSKVSPRQMADPNNNTYVARGTGEPCVLWVSRWERRSPNQTERDRRGPGGRDGRPRCVAAGC